MKEGFRHVEASTREQVSDREVAGYLGGSGNSEAKALLIASMIPSKKYSRSQLRDLLLTPQSKPGGREVWSIDISKVRDWCSDSLVPGGLIEEDKDGFQLTSVKANLAVALNGQLLAFSEEHPHIALMPFLGRASASSLSLETTIDGELKEAPPSPLTRYRLFKQLLSMPAPCSKIDVADAMIAEYPYQYRNNFLKTHVAALSSLGIIDSSMGENANTFTYQSEPREAQTIFRSPAALSMIEIMRSEPDKHWTMNMLHEVLRERGVVHQYFKTGLRQTDYIVNNLAREGYALKAFSPSEITVMGEQRKVLKSFVTIVDRLVSGDSDFIAEGKAKAAAIVSSPERFCRLLQKAEGRIADKTKTDPDKTKARAIAFLAANPNSTAVDVQEYLRDAHGQNLKIERVRMITTELCREKSIVVSEKGKVYRYSAAES